MEFRETGLPGVCYADNRVLSEVSVFGRLTEFEWERFEHYEVVEAYDHECDDGTVVEIGRRIVHRAQKGTAYKPLVRYPDLYRVFAGVKDEARLLEFIRNYGPVTDPGLTAIGDTKTYVTRTAITIDGVRDRDGTPATFENFELPGDNVEYCLKWAAWCAHVLKHQEKRGDRFLHFMNNAEKRTWGKLYVVADKVHGAELVIEPDDLLEAIVLQLVESIQKGVINVACVECGEWLTNKRAKAKYCSDECRHKHNNRLRK